MLASSNDEQHTSAENGFTPVAADDPAAADDRVAEPEGALLESARKLRFKGNDLFKAGQIEQALASYENALADCPESAFADKALIYGNISACLFRQQEYMSAVEHCTKALELNPGHARARLRRAEANMKIGDASALESAMEDYRKLEEENQSVGEAAKNLKILPMLIRQAKEKESAEALGKLKDLGNQLLGSFGLSLNNFNFVEKDGGYSVSMQK
ncbi:hypothetical protein HK101_009420 [Irineochytrium annulatum]|nr:hypothetical protein HK101_009420 [Irineochytrium annulatum]